jgi:CRP/FNR family transcriptional regulator, anaerobic regulatory protein
MTWENCKEAIRKISAISDEDFTLFEGSIKAKKVRKNEYFVKEGQVNKEIGFIGKGAFRMFYIKDGKEVNTEFYFENSFVSSYQSFLFQSPSRYYIEALEDSEIIVFKFEDLQKAYEKSHNWERFGRKVTECCYLEAMKRTESFLFLEGDQRYLKLLEENPIIFERVPLYHIASYLGIERESLSRVRRKILAI